MKIGSEVVLHLGDESHDAMFITGDENGASIVYLDPLKQSLLWGTDWRNAFVRLDGVKRVDHEDVRAGKEQRSWEDRAPSVVLPSVADLDAVSEEEKAAAEAIGEDFKRQFAEQKTANIDNAAPASTPVQTA